MAGLFDMLGGDEAAMQRQLDEQRAAKFAEQTQEQRLAGMGYKAGAGLGRGLAGAFGVDVQDPTIRRAAELRRAAQEYDITSADGLLKMAAAIKEQYPSDAQQLVQQAAVMAKGRADVDKTKAETEAKTQETAGKQARVATLVSSGLTQKEAEGLASSDTAFSNYLKVKKVETPVEYATQGLKLKFGAKPFLADYTPDQIKAMEVEVQKNKIDVARANRQTINLPPQEKAEQGRRGEMLVDQYKDVSKQATVAARTLPALESSLNIMDKGFDTGFGTEALATGAKVLAALGVEDAKSYATNAQSFLGAASQAVLTRQLEQKGPQTESDAARITQTGAQLGNTKEANRFLVSVAKTQFKRDLAQRSFYDEWFKSNKTYDGAEDAWFKGEGGKSLFDAPDLKKYKAKAPTSDQIPSSSSAQIPQAAIDALKAGKGTDAQFDAIFGQGAAKRIKGK